MVATKSRIKIKLHKLNTLEVMYAPKEGGIGDKSLCMRMELKLSNVYLLTAMQHQCQGNIFFGNKVKGTGNHYCAKGLEKVFTFLFWE